jgi:hypothetical protein
MIVEKRQAKTPTIDSALNRKAEVLFFTPQNVENIMQKLKYFYLKRSPILGNFIL